MWKIFNLILPLISRFSLHSNLINSSSIRLKPLRTEFYVFHFNSEFIRENKETSLSLLEHQVEPVSGPDCPSIDFALTLAGCWRRCWTVQERDKTPVSPGSTVEAGLARSGGDHGRTTIPRQGDSHSVITPPVLQVRTTRSTIIRGEGRGWGRLHLWKNEVRGQLLCSCRVSIF